MATAGGIEEDFIKCLAPTYVGSNCKLFPGTSDGFGLDGKTLRLQGLNRIGNMLVPNENYCKFEEWLMPILDKVPPRFAAHSVPDRGQVTCTRGLSAWLSVGRSKHPV